EGGVEPTQGQVRVSDGGCDAAQAIAGGARPRTCAARSHAQGAARIDPCFAAAARAHFHEVDHRRAHGIAASPPLAHRRPAPRASSIWVAGVRWPAWIRAALAVGAPMSKESTLG